jgi:chaperonin cofactor prefoldin
MVEPPKKVGIHDAILTIADRIDQATLILHNLASRKINKTNAFKQLQRIQDEVFYLSHKIEKRLFERAIPVYTREDILELVFYMRKLLDTLLTLSLLSEDTQWYRDVIQVISQTRKTVTASIRDMYQDIDRILDRIEEMRTRENKIHEVLSKYDVATFKGDKLAVLTELLSAEATLKEVFLRVEVLGVKAKG